MSSVSASFKQTLTRSFVNNTANGESGIRVFLESDFTAWVAANPGLINTIGSLYIIPGTAPGTTFVDVITGESSPPYASATALGYSGGTLTQQKTLRDLGTEIVIGNGIDSRLLVFRRVAAYFTSTEGQDATVGYVPIENNCEDLGPSYGRFTVRVARV